MMTEGTADAGEATLFAGHVRECVVAGIGRHVLVLLLSSLPAALRRPHHVRLARAAIEPLLLADRARLFALAGDDLAVVWRGDAATHLAAATTALVRLFEGEVGLPAGMPWAVFELPEQAEPLLAAIRPRVPAEPLVPAGPAPDRLDIRALEALETGLATVDVARFVRRRRVYAADPEGRLRPAWDQRFLSIAELTEAIAPGRAVEADPWLYRRLTRTLDQRMLALLAAPRELHDAGPFSVALNVTAILSPAFLRFDAALPAPLRRGVVIELSPADIVTDLAAFMFARDFAHDRGYRLMLRDMDADLMAVFPLGRIGLDFVQLQWSDALDRSGAADALPDAARTILSGTDTARALAWGRARGCGHFQGRMAEPA